MLTVPGGKNEDGQPWSAFPPDTCCEKLTLLLKFLVEPDGTHPNVDPFIIPSLENAANKTVVQEIYNAWLNQASVTTDTVKTFYDLVMRPEHNLPYVTTMGGKAASWFIPSMLTPHSWVSIKTIQNGSGEELVAKALFEEGDFKKWLARPPGHHSPWCAWNHTPCDTHNANRPWTCSYSWGRCTLLQTFGIPF